MKLSEAKTANAGFEKLTVSVRIDKQQLYPGCLTLKELHVDTSCELKPIPQSFSFVILQIPVP